MFRRRALLLACASACLPAAAIVILLSGGAACAEPEAKRPAPAGRRQVASQRSAPCATIDKNGLVQRWRGGEEIRRAIPQGTLVRVKAPYLRRAAILEVRVAHPAGYSVYTLGCLDDGGLWWLDEGPKTFLAFMRAASLRLESSQERLDYLRLYASVLLRGHLLTDVGDLLRRLSPSTREEQRSVARLRGRYRQSMAAPTMVGLPPWSGIGWMLRADQLVELRFQLSAQGQLTHASRPLETKLPILRWK
jgi:hypothetical protein